MRIADCGGYAVFQGTALVFLQRQHGGFNMDMRINETRYGNKAIRIQFMVAVIAIADSRNHAIAVNGNVRRLVFAGSQMENSCA